ncbi:MAG: DUF333 domain-containing protein [Candidatus Uhrbacteria bacterium]
MNKKFLIPIAVFALLIVGLAILRFSTPEDTWLCSNGAWIQHGNPSASMPTTACPGAVTETENDWQVYQNDELGFKFSYPKSFGNFDFKVSTESVKGEFSNSSELMVGGITKDFSAPRSSSYMDFAGFKKEDDKYFWGFIGNDFSRIIIPRKVISENIILVDCLSFEDKCVHTGPSVSLYEGDLAGLINLKDEKFTGLIFKTSEENIGEELLTEILSTFEFINSESKPIGLANPASVNCTDKGGTLAIEKRPDGGEFGVCYFEDNRQCEEWALMRGDCPVGGRKVTDYVTAAGRYCVIGGGEYIITTLGDENTERGNCVFHNGSVCEAQNYYIGNCPMLE